MLPTDRTGGGTETLDRMTPGDLATLAAADLHGPHLLGLVTGVLILAGVTMAVVAVGASLAIRRTCTWSPRNPDDVELHGVAAVGVLLAAVGAFMAVTGGPA